MAIEDGRGAIKTLLEATSNIVNVHDYERIVLSAEDLKEDGFLDEDGRMNFWEILASPMEAEYYASRTYNKFYNYTVRWTYGITDADETEKTLHEMVDDVIDVFLSNRTLTNNAANTTVSDPLLLKKTIGGVYCHVATFSIIAEEEVQGVNYT